MAGEIQLSYATSRTLYAVIRDKNAQVWNTDTLAFEAYTAANWADYAVTLAEQGSSGYYAGTFPATITAGTYSIVVKDQIGGTPAVSDGSAGQGNFEWGGTAPVPLSDLVTSGQLGQFSPMRMARGVMVQNFPFKLVSAVDHITAFTSGVVSGQVSRDGGNFGPLQSGEFTEVGLGYYKVNLTSGDLLANTVALSFSAVGVSGGTADRRDFSLILQKTSGQA